MQDKGLRETIAMLRELLADLDKRNPPGDWNVRRHMAQVIVRAYRYEFEYIKMKAKDPSIYVQYFEPSAPLTPKEIELYTEMEGLHLAIHRKLKAIRELR